MAPQNKIIIFTSIKVMNWIEVTDIKQLPYDRKSILAQDEYGNMGVVYWNSYNWVYYYKLFFI
mgnify:CR=1 FL=1